MTKGLCDCCCSEKIMELDLYRDYRHFRCDDCGFEHFSHRESTIAAALYENDPDYLDDLYLTASSEELILWHHMLAIEFLQSKFQPGNTTALDIGCFNGFFVKKLLSLGYNAQGVDFNKTAVIYGQRELGLGSRISTQSVEEMIEQGKRFDVITLFEVLEHVPDVKAFLANAIKLLKNDGVIILSTPNNKMCWRPALDYPPHHLSRFTTKSLEGLLSQLGMKTPYVAEQMSIFELVRHYVGIYFRANSTASLRGGEFKHKKITTALRRTLNRMRKGLGVMLWPVDKLLYLLGVRYISQIVIAEKREIFGL